MIYFLIALVTCAADQLLKHWVAASIPLGGTRELIPGVLGLSHVRNTGMAFSLLANATWLLSLISIAIIVAIAALLIKSNFTRWEKIALAFVMGGAAGNAIDRIFLGYVVDMFRTEFVDFAIFNLADAFIDVGAVLFCVLYIVRCVREERAKKAAKGGENADRESDDN